MTGETRVDGFLGGRLQIRQPAYGYRSGADAVMLAAACPAKDGDEVLDLGCGAGVASLCVGWRVPSARLAGVEQQLAYAELARQNAHQNGIALDVHHGDLARLPAALRRDFDHVIANPPYFTHGTPGPDAGRASARQEVTPLSVWLDCGLRRLRPGGWLTVIQRTDRLADLLSGLSGRAGDVTILPIAARAGREAGRIILRARKGGRGPLRLLAPFIMHSRPAHDHDGEDLTPDADAVLRGGQPLDPLFVKAP